MDKGRDGMDWFDPSDDVVINPATDAARFWRRRFGVDSIEVSADLIFANNNHGRLFEAVCDRLDGSAKVELDHGQQGYVRFRLRDDRIVTLCRAPEPAPYAAHNLELLIASGARRILFLNGAGSLRPELPVGSVLLPGELVREEGTSYHYVPADAVLETSAVLRARLREAADSLRVELTEGGHWTTDAIYRETRGKVERMRAAGVNSVDMELSALAGVASFRGCELAALHVVTDVLAGEHTWTGLDTEAFRCGAETVAEVAALAFV